MAIRRDPFSEMDRLFEQMRRNMMGGTMGPTDWGYDFDFEYDDEDMLPRMRSGMSMGRDVNLTLEETDDGYVAIADLPGFESEEIDLRFDDGMLIVAAEHELDEESEGLRRSLRRNVHERLSIPGDVIEEEISASYRNGVLEVTLPVSEEHRSGGHQIDIN